MIVAVRRHFAFVAVRLHAYLSMLVRFGEFAAVQTVMLDQPAHISIVAWHGLDIGAAQTVVGLGIVLDQVGVGVDVDGAHLSGYPAWY